MKFCLSSNVSREYLQKANEIRVPYNQHESIYNIKEINPEATIVLTTAFEKNGLILYDKDWDLINQYNNACEGNFKLCLQNEEQLPRAIKMQINAFPFIPIKTFESLRSMIAYGVKEVYIAGQIAHNLKLLSHFDMSYRLVPNRSFVQYGIDPRVGSWVRPEDINTLEDVVQVCEFFESDSRREQALYRIYAEDKVWSGDLQLLVEDLEKDKIMNRMIHPDFQDNRNNCNWKCISGRIICHLCNNHLYLANPELYKIKDKESENIE